MSYIKGKGGIQTNSTKNDGAGISTESQMDEKLHQKIVTEAVDKVFGFNRKGWTFKTSEKLNWLTKKVWGWGVTKTGKSTRLDADGYFIYYNNKLVGVTEHKRQADEGNACERVFRYVAIAWNRALEPWQIFASFSGPGFYKPILHHTGGGQTGGTIELLLDLGVTIETNPTSEELDNSLCGWMYSLIDKYEN